MWTVQRAGPGPGPFFRLCEACARWCSVCSTGVTLQPWSAESGEISGAAGVSQAGVRLSLPSPSSCLPRLIPPPQSRKIGREITGMTSRKVRRKVNYEPDLRPDKHQHRRLPRPTPRRSPSPGHNRLRCRKMGQDRPNTGGTKPQDWSSAGQIWSAIVE